MSRTTEAQPAARTALILALLFLLSLALLSVGLHSLTRNNNLGIDYYIYYVAGRTLLIEDGNPYGDDVARQVQLAVLKRPARPDEDQLGFAYPLYGLIPALPTFWLSYDWAQAVWLALNLLLLVTAVLLAFPRAPSWSLSVLLMYPFAFALLTGNLNLIVTAILLLAYGLLSDPAPPARWKQSLIGLMLAWSTAKPQFAWLLLAFLLLWMLRRKLWWGLGSFAGGLIVFLALSFAAMPNWPLAWYERVVKYTEYNQAWMILTLFLKEFLPTSAAQSVTLAVGILCAAASIWLFYHWWCSRLISLQMAAWCGFIIFLFHPHGAAYEQIPFLLPLLLWICTQKPLPTLPVALFWGGSLLLSWVFFLLSRAPGMPPSIAEWPFLFYLVWLAYIMKQSKPGMV